MKRSAIIAKTIVILILFIVYGAVSAAFAPTLTNELALQQMGNDEVMNASWRAYNYFRGYGWLIPIVVGVLIFGKEIKYLTTKKDKKES